MRLKANALPLFSITSDSISLRWNVFLLIFFSNSGVSTTSGLLDFFPIMKGIKEIQKFFGNNNEMTLIYVSDIVILSGSLFLHHY